MGRIKMPSGTLFRRGQSDVHKLIMSRPREKNYQLQLNDVANLIRLGSSLYESPLLRDTLGAVGEFGAGMVDMLSPDEEQTNALMIKAAAARQAQENPPEILASTDTRVPQVTIDNPLTALGVPHQTTITKFLDAGFNLDLLPPAAQAKVVAAEPGPTDPLSQLSKQAQNKNLSDWANFRIREAEIDMLQTEADIEATKKRDLEQRIPEAPALTGSEWLYEDLIGSAPAPQAQALPDDPQKLLDMLEAFGHPRTGPRGSGAISGIRYYMGRTTDRARGIALAQKILTQQYNVGVPGVSPVPSVPSTPTGQEAIGMERLRRPTAQRMPMPRPVELQMPPSTYDPSAAPRAAQPSPSPAERQRYEEEARPMRGEPFPETLELGELMDPAPQQAVIDIISEADLSPEGQRAAVQKALNVAYNIADNLEALSEAVITPLEQSGRPYTVRDIAALTSVVAQHYGSQPQTSAGINTTIERGDNLASVQAKAYSLGKANADPRHLQKLLSQLSNISGIATGGGGWARFVSGAKGGGYFINPDRAAESIWKAFEAGQTGDVKARRDVELAELRQLRMEEMRDPVRARKREAQAGMAEFKLEKAQYYRQLDKVDRYIETATAAAKLGDYLKEHTAPITKVSGRRRPKSRNVTAYNKQLISSSKDLQKFNRTYQKDAKRDVLKLNAVMSGLKTGDISNVPKLTNDEIVQLYGTNANAFRAGLRAAKDDEAKRKKLMAATQVRINAISGSANLVNVLQERVITLHDNITRQLRVSKTEDRDKALTELHNQLTAARKELNKILGKR